MFAAPVEPARLGARAILRRLGAGGIGQTLVKRRSASGGIRGAAAALPSIARPTTMWILGAGLLALGCTGPEQVEPGSLPEMEAVSPSSGPPRFAGFHRAPPLLPVAPVPDAAAHYRRQFSRGPTPRRRRWRVIEDVADHRASWHAGDPACPAMLPRLPAVSADGAVLALGLGAFTHRGELATVRLIRTADGALLGEHRLSPDVGSEPGGDSARARAHRTKICGEVQALAQVLAPGGFSPMPAVASWAAVSTRRRTVAWALVVSDGATREVGGTWDIVVGTSEALNPEQIAIEPLPDDWGGDRTAWAAGSVVIATMYYVGC